MRMKKSAQKLKPVLYIALVLLLSPLQALAGERSRFGELTDVDWNDMQQIITLQLAAFESDDDVAAFSHASFAIKRRFRTPENFLATVKLTYPAIYRPRAVEFLGHYIYRGFPYQRLQVVAPDGTVLEAHYKMQRERDRSWKIDGCTLKPSKATLT
jgi:Domain of unknown function (DUF4864)